MSIMKNMSVDEYSNESITHAPFKKLKNIKILKSCQKSRRDSVEKTQIDCSQESKHTFVTKPYYNILKRRVHLIEGMIKIIE